MPTVAVGCVITLSSCGKSSMPGTKTIVFDEANREIFVQPIRVCDDFGQNCARMNLFAEMTAKILEQASLKVNFLPANQLNNSRFLTIGDEKNSTDELYELSRKGQAADYGRHEDSTRTEGPINVWFVDEFLSSSGNVQFGSAWVDANGVIVSEETIDFNGGKGRPDTLAHEIGHNLGLKHTTFGAGGSDNLLTEGNSRNVPGSVDDIYPNGAGLSRLTTAQINEILNSGFVTERTTSADAIASVNLALADLTTSNVTSADLASFSLTSLQLEGSSAAGASQVPEPTSWLALGVLGLSSMLVLRRQPQMREKSASCLIPHIE